MTYNNLQPTDTMLVNRDGNSYQVPVDSIKNNDDSLRDDDVFLVNRGSNSYKVTKGVLASEIGGGGVSAPGIASVVLTETPNDAGRFTDAEFPFATTLTSANPAPTYGAKVKLSGATFDFDFRSGVIDSVEGNQITIDGTGSLDLLDGEEIKMTKGDGELAEYTLTTNVVTGAQEVETTYVTGSATGVTSGRPWENSVNGSTGGYLSATYAVWEFVTPLNGDLSVYGTNDSANMQFTVTYDGGRTSVFTCPSAIFLTTWQLGNFSNITKLEQTASSASNTAYAISALYINGEIILEKDTARVLSFQEPNPDLQYFKKGDLAEPSLVQTELSESQYNQTFGPGSPNNSTGAQGPWRVDFRRDHGYSGNTTMCLTAAGSGDENANVVLYDGNGDVYFSVKFRNLPAGVFDIGSDFAPVRAISTSGSSSSVKIAWFKAGTTFINPPYDSSKVVTKDVEPGETTLQVEKESTLGMGDVIRSPVEGGQATVANVTNNELSVIMDSGRFIGSNSQNEEFYIEPTTPIQISGSTAWGVAQFPIVDNQLYIRGIQGDEPEYTPIPSKDYEVKFANQFTSGNEPDDDLPVGTSIQVCLSATNDLGTGYGESNTITPEEPNPEGLAGPIRNVSGAVLTTGSQNLNSFDDSDPLVMCTEDGAVASYIPVTADITGEENAEGPEWSNAQYWSGLWYTEGSNNPFRFPQFDQWPPLGNPFPNQLRGWGNDNNGDTMRWGPALQNQQGLLVEKKLQIAYGTYNNANIAATLSLKFEGENLIIYEPEFTGGNWCLEFVLDIVGEPKRLEYINVEASSWPMLSAVRIDDAYVTDNVTSKELSFALPNQDLKYFKPGDLIQDPDVRVTDHPNIAANTLKVSGGSWGDDAEAGFIKTQVWSRNGTNILEGRGIYGFDGLSSACQAGGTGKDAFFIFDPPLENVFTIQFNTTNWSNGWWPDGGSVWCQDTEGNRYTRGTAPNMSGIPVSCEGSDIVRVGTLGTTNMWTDLTVTSANGNGILKDSTKDLQVRGPSRSGTGKFKSKTGDTAMVIEESNGQWIDNQNRLGLEFYVRESITKLDANNPKHVAIQQAIAEAFAAYPAKEAARLSQIADAVNRAAATLSDEEAALLYGITGVTPPNIQHLIPDNWSQEQRLAAMKELMDEYRSHEESN